MEIIRHYPLKKCNTFGIEVFADAFAEVQTTGELLDILSSGSVQSRKLLFLGGGSNILFLGDFKGMVVKIGMKGLEIIAEDDDIVRIRVAAGEDWDGLAGYCAGKGWGGLENLSGIPGQTGSSPIQNIGAYGTELKDHFISLEAINTCNGELTRYDREQCRFGYRDSIFKRALKGRMVITHVVLELRKKPEFNLSYQALRQHLSALPDNGLSVMKVREAVLAIRASKLPDPKTLGNAGSFFKNPVVSREKLDQLKERFPAIVYFDAPALASASVDAGRPIKLAAGWLIEQCGWRGHRKGDAGVHKDQALVLVNHGHATGLEIMSLSEDIRKSVMQKFGVELEREVNVI